MPTSVVPDFAKLPVIQDLRRVLLAQQPVLDVRAPIEFQEGSLPSAINLPLMDDADRAAIGTRYKQAGQSAAIQLGLQRVSGTVKEQRIAAWVTFFQRHPQAALFCFRGGLRSRITQQWLYEATGQLYPRVQGGYKALRRSILTEFEQLATWLQPVVLSGRTGAGKTQFLHSFQQQIDLEKWANHRGSAFGAQLTAQPSQADFENMLMTALLQQQAHGHTRLLFEDESRTIGSVHLIEGLYQQLRAAPLVILHTSDAERWELSFQVYVVERLQALNAYYQDEATSFASFEQSLLASLRKIQTRLGGVRYTTAVQLIQQALAEQKKHGTLETHRLWVRFLLMEYYDPMYDYQLSRKQERVIFQGHANEVREFLQHYGIK